MPAPRKRRVAAVCGDGHIRLIEQDVPALRPGAVLVEVHASLVSPGTELNGWHSLRVRREEPKPDAKPRPFGYANAGVVLKVGEGVKELAPGQRVCCMGGGYALHTDYALVPHNLCVPLPDGVSFERGSYGHLAATAVHALRRGAPEFGEWACVVGLGLVGQLCAQVYRLAGNFVIGWEGLAFRRQVADRCGIDATVAIGEEDAVAATRQFTGGEGLDAAVIAFGGDATETIPALEKAMKCSPDGHPMGRIVIVGAAHFAYTDTLTNMDIRRSSRPGPGYHDEAWEYGPDYPPVFMRWTTRTNLALSLRLIAEGRINVDPLTTHTIPLADVDEGVSAALDDPDSILGVVFVRSGS
jgi:threonine dehydrogenase-like Zn-dependent dehydrogenase